MNIFRSMDISGSALTAQRFRMDIVGENIANATTTRTADGTPYRRKYVIFEERPLQFSDYLSQALSNENTGQMTTGTQRLRDRYASSLSHAGVKAVDVAEDQSDFKMHYDPEHPDANEEGYVMYPNVDMEREMVDFISATRSYEANITALNNFKNIAMKALEIGK